MTDSRLTADLALLGRVAQERLPSAESSLKRFEAATTNHEHLAVSLAQLFVQRAGRIAAGAAAVVGIVGMFAHITVNVGPYDREQSLVEKLLAGPQIWVATMLFGLAAIVYALTTVFAARHVEHVLKLGGVPAAQRLVDGVEPWDVGLTIAGVLTPILFFGMMRVVLGPHALVEFMYLQTTPELSLPWSSTFALTVGALGAAWLGAILVARRSSTFRIPAWAVVAAAAIFLVTVWVGVRFDAGPANYQVYVRPSVPLRAALAATGTFSLLVLVSAAVLRRRR